MLTLSEFNYLLFSLFINLLILMTFFSIILLIIIELLEFPIVILIITITFRNFQRRNPNWNRALPALNLAHTHRISVSILR